MPPGIPVARRAGRSVSRNGVLAGCLGLVVVVMLVHSVSGSSANRAQPTTSGSGTTRTSTDTTSTGTDNGSGPDYTRMSQDLINSTGIGSK